MPKTIINPDTLFPSTPFGFSQVVASDGRKTVYCAGQAAWDKDMNFIGEGDLARQLDQALHNVRCALEAAGATPQDVVRVTTYVVDYGPDQIETITTALAAFFGAEHLPASTLLGVERLALPEFLVEIEVTAVID